MIEIGEWVAALTPETLMLCAVGAVVGTVIGVLPGIGPPATVALLLPLTFALDPAGALVMLAAIYYGAQYGSSTTAILMNLPGETSGIVTALDGHRMALDGRAAPAIAIAALSSLFAGLATAVFIAVAARPVAEASLLIAPAGLAGLIALGLFAAAVISPGNKVAAVALIMAGACLGLVGTDSGGGQPRFTLGLQDLRDGIGFVPMAMGLFGLAEIIRAIESGGRPERIPPIGFPWPTRADLRAALFPTLRGTVIGSVLGVIPGATTVMSSLAARGVEKLFRQRGKPLGHGAVEGVAAPEAANNASSQAALVPLLTLGLPGNPVMAVLAGALAIHGISAGPAFIAENPDVFQALVASLVVGNLILVVLNLPFAGLWAMLLSIPFRRLAPGIVAVSLIGVFSVRNALFDVWVMLAFGLIGWTLSRLRLEPTPLALGFILGPAFEEYLRRTLLFSRGDLGAFLRDPVSLACLALIALGTLLLAARGWRGGGDGGARQRA
jgi:TctA family transporter